ICLASLARPVGISLVYLLFFFVSPWLSNKSQSERTALKIFSIITFASSLLFSVGHLIIHISNVLFSYLNANRPVANILRQIGFVNLTGLKTIVILHWILPDIIVAIISLIVCIYMKVSSNKVPKKSVSLIMDEGDESTKSIRESDLNRLLIISYIRSVLKTTPVFSLLILHVTAVLRPSLPGSLYFMMFILAGTYWALYKQLHWLFYPLIIVLLVLLAQIICFISYQLPITQNYFDPEGLWLRAMGMEVLLILFKQNWNGMILRLNTELDVDSYLNPIALMWAYFIVTLNVIHCSKYKSILATMKKRPLLQIIYSPEQRDKTITREQPSTLEQVFYMIYHVTSFIYKHSYILLNISMMIWSIIYHSWLTFVLLIWANILWIIPNQRRSMMRSSFFVVLYAELLLIAQYIYGMKFYENEVPTKIYGINLQQIGFVHPQDMGIHPCIPLGVKTIFLFIFWITSHQYFKEKDENKSDFDLYSTVFGPPESRSELLSFEKSRVPRIIMFIIESISNFITRVWMWMLIFLIFLCAMIDQAMTGFRICYMSLFLLFLMVFQMSLQLWIKFLYGYWMFVIFYAMSMLTIIYTYQFDYFDYYWEHYFQVLPTLQNDIGLRRYRTTDLFLHLLVPTLTVIFTVIQLHYFHRPFMDSVRQPMPTSRSPPNPQTEFNYHESKDKDVNSKRKSWIARIATANRKIRQVYHRWFRSTKQITWRLLEMHMIKIVILTTFICAISEICFFNLILVVCSLLSVCVNRLCRRIIFRINNKTVNFAEWMGLRKTTHMWGDLSRYIAPYIVYMIVTTIYAVVKFRDHLIRFSLGEIKVRAVLFPQITRQDAEHDFACLLKYLLNYGYFKFGLEITLIALVSAIVQRRDLLSITYVFWLILLLSLNRTQCARVWIIFQMYFVLSVLVQYLYQINFPPHLCLCKYNVKLNCKAAPNLIIFILAYEDKAYTNDSFHSIFNDPIKSRLILDFIVLLFITRQRKAFKVELKQAYSDVVYAGGDNKDIVHNIAKLGHVYFRNPTHDFCSFVRNYSDVFKTLLFCSFLWITLAVVFMGGVCGMDMLSFGYLIFALVFLLQGSEVYLQNIHYIIWQWNFLIAFNVFNIVIKDSIIVFGNMLGVKHKQDYQSLFAVLQYDSAKIQTPNDYPSVGYHYGPNSLIFKNILIWHAIIFAFIIFQSRIFRSYYFCHIIMDTQANSVLASRGAIIIQNLHYKQIYDRRECEKRVLKNVKTKMEKIRATNDKNYK
ncbi:hypothetical protein KR222_008389, partial [Zaprionus bogoriensis]